MSRQYRLSILAAAERALNVQAGCFVCRQLPIVRAVIVAGAETQSVLQDGDPWASLPAGVCENCGAGPQFALFLHVVSSVEHGLLLPRDTATVKHRFINPWQAKYLLQVAQTAISIGGVGSGKSYINAIWFVLRLLLYPKARHFIMAATHPQLKEGAMHTLKDTLDDLGFLWVQNKSDLSIGIQSGPAAGVRVVPWTSEMWPRLKSIECDSFFLDEVQTYERGDDVFAFVLTRMRQSPQAKRFYPDLIPSIRVGANPPPTMAHWIYRQWIEENEKKPKEKQLPVFTVSTFDNYLIPQREQYIDRLRESFSPERFKLEVMGEWVELKNRQVYTSFSRAANVSEAIDGLPPIEYDPFKPLCWLQDFGVVPRVSLLGQVHTVPKRVDGYQGQLLYIFDEITINPGSTDEQVEEFCRQYPPQYILPNGTAAVREVIMYGDASGQNRNSTTAQSDWQMLVDDPRLQAYRGRINKRSQNPPPLDRVNAVTVKLRNAKDEVGIIIHPRCTDLIRDLASCSWKEGNSRQIDHGTPSKGIHLSHWSDALGYMVFQEWPLVDNTFRIRASGGYLARVI